MIRWMIKRNTVTAEMVREYAAKEGLPTSVAKKELVNEQMSLQYRDEVGGWIDVPNVVVYRDDITGKNVRREKINKAVEDAFKDGIDLSGRNTP